eukprot:12260032-Ditylum_brightwellii.AAC.1
MQKIFQQLQEKQMYHQFKLILGQSRAVQAELMTLVKIKSLRDTSLHLSSPTIQSRTNNFIRFSSTDSAKIQTPRHKI